MKYLILPVIVVFLLWVDPLLAKPVTVGKIKNRNPRLFVLTVGVNDYDDDFFPDLRWAERDADRFAREVGKDTGYEVVRKTISGKDATRESIRTELTALAARASGQDAFLIFLSSHGSLVAGSSGDLEPVMVLPSTDSKALASTSLPLSLLLRWIDRIPARRKFMITASCHSGVGKSRLTPEMQERLAQAKGSIELEMASEGTIVLSAAARNEVAVEDNKLKSDLYTHYFLGALSIYDRDQDGAVSVLEAHDYATEMAFKFSNGKQRPTIQAEVIGNVDVPLRGKSVRKGLPVLAGYDDRFSGLEVEVNRQPKGRLPFAFPLKPGRNEVILYSQDGNEKIGRYLLKARAGETVSVDDILSGHPFAAGFYFAQMKPAARAFQKLADGNILSTGYFGRYRHGRFDLGLDIQLPANFSATVLKGLDASSRQQSMAVRPGYRLLDLGSLSLLGDLVIGQDEFTIKIQDRSTGYSEEESSRAMLIGAGMGIYWNVLDTMLFSLTGSQLQVKHDFGPLGKIDTSRRLTMFGLRFTFGGKARKR